MSLHVVVYAAETSSDDMSYWTVFTEHGYEKGRIGLSPEGTEELMAALRGAGIRVTNVTTIPADEDTSNSDV